MTRRSRRSNVSPEQIKKNREKLFGKKKTELSTYEKNRKKQQLSRSNSSLKSNDKKVTTTKLTGAEKAKAMAKARIKSGKTINDLKIANKAAMKARAKAKYEAFKKRRNK